MNDQSDLAVSADADGMSSDANGCAVALESEAMAPLTALRVLDELPDALVLLDDQQRIVWCSQQFQRWFDHRDVLGLRFYEALGSPDILGPDFAPLHSAPPARSTLRLRDGRYLQLQTLLLDLNDGDDAQLALQLRDATRQTHQQQKLDAIHRAGMELAALCPEELACMDVQERIELLKSKIIHHTQDLLQFDTVEIRLLDRSSSRLVPLLAVGMTAEAVRRELYASEKDNGVTGFVAATGKSYLCDDTARDPLYLEGAHGARSSLTVPLVLHDQVIGTFNVESPESGAFDEDDLKFLEIFSRDIAAALNTLDLLAAEKATTTTASIEAVHREVALPADEVLIDAAWLLERYIGHDADFAARLLRILQNTRAIKQLIQKVGDEMVPPQPNPPRAARPAMKGKRILVVDNEDGVRQAAHSLLERYGCLVESAHDGKEAVVMARTGPYDLVLADIRLPDMNGYDCLCRVREVLPEVPVILMTGFGYDPAHSIVKARRAGLKHVLYKPFRVDQLLQAVEAEITCPSRPTAQPPRDPDGADS